MILGAHESVAGGLELSLERGKRDGAEAVQLWVGSSRQWEPRPLPDALVGAFQRAKEAHAPRHTASHACYLINLASPDDTLWQRSIAALTDECLRAERLGVGQVIVHPGAHQGTGAKVGVRRVADALKKICAGIEKKASVRLLLEHTAGQGSSVGCTFEELAGMLDGAGHPRLGVCLDTQHLFAAGYEWTTARGYDAVFADFERIVGLGYLEAFHLNDSKRPLGARVDRHERIGDGQIGLLPFERLVRDARFAALPGYLETPPLENGDESYAQGLLRLRSLLLDAAERRELPRARPASRDLRGAKRDAKQTAVVSVPRAVASGSATRSASPRPATSSRRRGTPRGPRG